MLIYIVVLVILLILRNNNSRMAYISCFLLLSAIAGFRDVSVGSDTVNYLERYLSFNDNTDVWDNPLSRSGEYFESILYFFGNKFRLSFGQMLQVESVIFVGLVFVFFINRLEKPLLGVLIFFLLWFYFPIFNIMRNIMAVVVMMFGYLVLENRSIHYLNYEKKKKWLSISNIIRIPLFIFIVVLASFVHKSVAVGVLLLLFKYVKMDVRVSVALAFVALMIGMLVPNLAQWVNGILGMFEDFSMYNGYIRDLGSHLVITPFLEIAFFALIYHYYGKKLDLENNLYYKAWAFELIFLNLFTFSFTYGSRVVLVFSVAKCILFADCLKLNNIKGTILIYLFLFYHFTRCFISGYDGIIPYKFASF